MDGRLFVIPWPGPGIFQLLPEVRKLFLTELRFGGSFVVWVGGIGSGSYQNAVKVKTERKTGLREPWSTNLV